MPRVGDGPARSIVTARGERPNRATGRIAFAEIVKLTLAADLPESMRTALIPVLVSTTTSANGFSGG
jgi:hypothetical protein